MNPLKMIARNDGARLALGGVVSGGAIYGLVHPYPGIGWIAVPIAIVVGAFCCFVLEHLTEAVFKAVIVAVPVFLMLRKMPRFMAKDPSWWEIAIMGLLLGLLGGMAVGSLLGGVCRRFWSPGIRHPDGD